jgi:asparagine synthase (glutamine-hydrolysing)
MCGIFGIVRLNQAASPFDISLAKAALLKMQHRGPDANNLVQLSDNVLFGHLRLSIIDLTENNNQPFSDPTQRYHLTYNGELYNYLEIKKILCEKGYIFSTTGDTEVLLYAYMEWGSDCVKYFNGMWAFAIYDAHLQSLFCSRDRFGVKPFYYALHENHFIFASEIKSIITYFTKLKQPNYNIISNFCRKSLGAQSEETWMLGIKRLLPAHQLIVGTAIAIERYWNYPSATLQVDIETASRTYQQLFVDAVRLRMRADVPVGTTLSGGVDSPSIVAAMRTFYDGKHSSYTAFSDTSFYTPNDKYLYRENIDVSEHELVKQLNKSFQLTEHIQNIDYQNYTKQLQNLIYYLESPHPFTTIFPLSQLYQSAAKEVKVLLEGQGADELLGGYVHQVIFYALYDLIKAGQFRTFWRELTLFRKHYSLKFALLSFFRTLNINILQNIYARFQGLDKLYREPLQSYSYIKDSPFDIPTFDNKLNAILFEQHTGVLVSLLHYGDALSMMHSLESRLPFMDYRLVEWVFQMPTQYKLRDGFGKYLHRKSLAQLDTVRGSIVSEIFQNRVKIGFHSPTAVLFQSDAPDSPASILLSERCLQRGLFDEKTLRAMIASVRAGKGIYGAQLFRLLGVELWFRTWIDE